MDQDIRPYRGISVLDAGQGVAGPYCGMLLAAFGADVLKVEPPEGDWSRGLSSRKGGQSVMSATFNRGKRGLVLDLKDQAAQKELMALAGKADVVIESFRPGVAARLGLSPENTRADAVCVSISGFGQTGPQATRPCTDSVSQAFGGLLSVNLGMDDVPHRTGAVLTSDVVTGLYAFIAVQAALAQRKLDTAPQRRVLDVSLMQGTANLMAFPIAEWALLGERPAALNAPAGTYQAACGGWVMVALVRETEWVSLATVLGLEPLLTDPRYQSFAARSANKATLLPAIRQAFMKRNAEAWFTDLHAARLLAEKVNTPLDWLAEPQVAAMRAVNMVQQPELGRLPFPVIPGVGAWDASSPGLPPRLA